MPLPNPGMNFDPLTPLPAESLNNMVENIEALADGTGLNNGVIPNRSYSTAEVATPDKWVDGKTIYRKTINFGALPNNTAKTVPHGIVGIDRVIRMYGFASLANGSVRVPLPFTSVTSLAAGMALTEEGSTNVVISTGSDRTSFSGYVTLEYTKV